jgi:imidazolonepropionase-like amidohydrolase
MGTPRPGPSQPGITRGRAIPRANRDRRQPATSRSELQLIADAAHHAGVRLVCSSDAGVRPWKPHDCLPHGVIYFGARLGFTSAQALSSVTSLAAQACAAGDRKGRIAPGYDADLLAVAGNPAADLTAILNPTAIYRAGHLCDTGPPSPP